MSFLTQLQNQKEKLKQTPTIVTKADGQRYIERNHVNILNVAPNVYGFVVDTQPDNIPVMIRDHLYIGSQDCTADNIIKKFDIKHVLSLGINVDDILIDNKFINCLDLPETDIKDVLKESLPYIRGSVDTKENVLVHCNAGVSRTSMVAIGYLMHYEAMSFEDSYNLVKSKRPAIRPNDGFQKQLRVMEPGGVI